MEGVLQICIQRALSRRLFGGRTDKILIILLGLKSTKQTKEILYLCNDLHRQLQVMLLQPGKCKRSQTESHGCSEGRPGEKGALLSFPHPAVTGPTLKSKTESVFGQK